MAWYHHWEIVRNIPAGDGINSVQVQAYRHSDDSTIGSPVTTSTVDGVIGSAQFLLATTSTTGTSFELFPGPYYLESTHNGVTRRKSSRDIGTSGPIDLFAQLFINHAMGSGIVQNPPLGLNEMACTSAGLARTVVVASGAGVIRGLPFFNHLARTVTIAANTSGNPRIDTIVLQMVPAGNATEGWLLLKVVAGTPAASPVPPTLTQDTSFWQEPLCDVAVANGASVITQGNITDRRDLIERAVSDLEGDLSALEDRVDDLEDVVPREEIVATYAETLDPPLLAAGAASVIQTLDDSELTFHNGYTEIDRHTMYATASHLGCNTLGMNMFANIMAVSGSPDPPLVVVFAVNYSTAQNPVSATLYVVIKKLVTS